VVSPNTVGTPLMTISLDVLSASAGTELALGTLRAEHHDLTVNAEIATPAPVGSAGSSEMRLATCPDARLTQMPLGGRIGASRIRDYAQARLLSLTEG